MRLMLGRDEEITLSKVSLKTSMRVQSVKGCALFFVYQNLYGLLLYFEKSARLFKS